MADSDSDQEHHDFSQSHNFPQNTPVSIKLTEDNFLIWKQHVLSAVRGYNLEGFLTGEKIPPPQTIVSRSTSQERANPDFSVWYMQDQRIAHWIQSSLSESVMILVVGLNTSHEIWSALETSFAHQSKAKVMQYMLQLQTARKESLSMRAYLNKVKGYCDLLGAAGCRVSEEDHIMHILAGLGKDYNSAVVTITSRTEGWTVKDVSALLTSYEQRLDDVEKSSSISSDGSLPTANLMQTANQRTVPSNNNTFRADGNTNYRTDGGRNYNFRGRGGRSGGRGGRSRNKIICQLCQKPGHSADQCWHLPSFVPNGPQMRTRNQMGQGGGHQLNPSANVVQTRNQNDYHSLPSQHVPSEYGVDVSSSASRYPDSGATNHISNDFGNFNSASEYNGGKLLHLGDGKGIGIKHVGNSVF